MKLRILSFIVAMVAAMQLPAAVPVIPERPADAKPWRGTKKPVYKMKEWKEALDVAFTLEQPILLAMALEDSENGKELSGKVLRNPVWQRDYASKHLVTLFIEIPVCPEGEETPDAVQDGTKPKKQKSKPQPRGRRAKRKKMVMDINAIKDAELRAFVKSCLEPLDRANKFPYSWLYLPYKKGTRKACMQWKVSAKVGDYYEFVRVQMESLGLDAEFSPGLKKLVEMAARR